MELGSDRAAHEEKLMAEIAEEYPDVTVERIWGVGFECYPKGVTVLRAIEIDAMQAKLKRRRDQAPG
jgi:hypothetical protein